MSLYLAIDLGTTGCRSILFDQQLNTVSTDYEEYALSTPQEKWVEQDAETWWELTLRTAKNAIRKAALRGDEIDSISISSQGITVVPVDRDVQPLCAAMTWLDTRAEEQAAQIRADFGDGWMGQTTGKPITAAYTLPKLLWLKQHRRSIYEQAYKFLLPMDYLIAKFTGRFVTDHSMASGTLLYDVKNACWHNGLLSRYGIDIDTLPTLARSGEAVGYVLPSVAAALGLRADCVIAVGAQDQKCAAYGVGLQDGVMTVSLGTAAAVTKRWDTYQPDLYGQGMSFCGYIDPDTFVSEGVVSTAGTCLRWARDTLFPDTDYRVIDAEAAAAASRGSSLLFFPYLSGENGGTFHGITLATDRGEMALAVMKGVAYEIRSLLERMNAYGNVHTVILFGGGAKGDLWPSILADVTGLTIHTPKTCEAAGAGAARLAAKAVGVTLSPLNATRVFKPQNTDNGYSRFCAVKQAIQTR